MTVTGTIVDETSTAFTVELTATASERVVVTAHRSGREPMVRPVQTLGLPSQLAPVAVTFDGLEPDTRYQITIESSARVQEILAQTTH